MGDGGDVGGNGRIEASSSASGGLEGDHKEPGASDGENERGVAGGDSRENVTEPFMAWAM